MNCHSCAAQLEILPGRGKEREGLLNSMRLRSRPIAFLFHAAVEDGERRGPHTHIVSSSILGLGDTRFCKAGFHSISRRRTKHRFPGAPGCLDPPPFIRGELVLSAGRPPDLFAPPWDPSAAAATTTSTSVAGSEERERGGLAPCLSPPLS